MANNMVLVNALPRGLLAASTPLSSTFPSAKFAINCSGDPPLRFFNLPILNLGNLPAPVAICPLSLFAKALLGLYPDCNLLASNLPLSKVVGATFIWGSRKGILAAPPGTIVLITPPGT